MRLVFLLLVLCLSAAAPDAQRRLSGRAGVVFASFGDAGDLDQSPYIAPTAGLAIRFPLLPVLDAEFDLSVLPRGATSTSEEGREERLRFSYFDLSLLARAHVQTRSRAHIAAFAGPTVSVLLQEAFEDEIGQVQITELSKGTHLAGTLGALAGYRDVSVEVRYVRGLSTFVTDEVLAAEIVSRPYVHQALVISLGLRL